MIDLLLFVLFIVLLVVGSSIYLWLLARLFSMFSGKFVYVGNASHSPCFVFQITSKECLATVKRGANSIVASCEKVGFTNYEIWVVTENPNPPTFADDRIRVIAVPDEFECNARYKARNLEYGRRLRIREAFNGWVYFMDEENSITEQTIRAITNFAEHGNSKLASGPLMFNSGGSKFVWLADSIRESEARVCHLGHSLGWWPLYGENLLMHSEVETKVGWEYSSLTEDIWFTAYAGQKGYRTGWHGGGLFSTSPTSLVDFIRQRRRWFRGMLQLILGKSINLKYRALELYLLLCALLGILFVPGIVANFIWNLAPSFALWYSCPALLLFSAAYFTGCRGSLKDRVTASLLSGVFGILEAVAAWLSLIRPPRGFDIVKKA